jgi:hypothetical protein
MAWATISECTAITGVTPDAATLALAQSSVEDHVNRSPDVTDSLYARDLYWLKKAVAWQAAWLPAQHDLLTRTGVQTVTQDGMSAQFRTPADQLLSPHAQRALKNVSWLGSRSVRFDSRGEGRYSEAADGQWLHEGSDDDHGWDALQ